MKILEQKKDKNAKNNHTSKNSKDCNINILYLKMEDIINNIELNNLIINLEGKYPNNYYYVQNIVNIAEYIEEEDRDDEKKNEKDEEKEKAPEYEKKLDYFANKYNCNKNIFNKEKNQNLTKLDLSSKRCGDILLKDLYPLINSSNKIITLILDDNKLRDLSLLGKMPLYHLTYLDLSLNLITNIKFLKNLSSIRSLESLYLHDNKINNMFAFLNDKGKIRTEKIQILTLKNNCLDIKEEETRDVFIKLFEIEDITLDYKKEEVGLK